MKNQLKWALDWGYFFQVWIWFVMLQSIDMLFNLLPFRQTFPFQLIFKLSDFSDKVQLLPDKIDRIVLFDFLVQNMAAHNMLNNEWLNLIDWIVRQSTTIFNWPVWRVWHKLLLNQFSVQRKSFCQWLDLGWIYWLDVQNLNLSVLFLACFQVINLRADLIILLRSNL